MSTTPPGWFDDPQVPGQLRYWDGAQWTEHVQPQAAPPAEGVILPPPQPRTRNWPVIIAAIVVGVVLLGGVCTAIAVPTFLGAQDRAHDRKAQSSARNALVAAKTISTDSLDYGEATPGFLADVEPSVRYAPGESTGPDWASVVGARDVFVVAVRSKSGTCWVLRDDISLGTAGGTLDGACTATLDPLILPSDQFP